jgi:hypothetical protein
MLTQPAYRASPVGADSDLPARAFLMLETTPVPPPKLPLLDRAHDESESIRLDAEKRGRSPLGIGRNPHRGYGPMQHRPIRWSNSRQTSPWIA